MRLGWVVAGFQSSHNREIFVVMERPTAWSTGGLLQSQPPTYSRLPSLWTELLAWLGNGSRSCVDLDFVMFVSAISSQVIINNDIQTILARQLSDLPHTFEIWYFVGPKPVAITPAPVYAIPQRGVSRPSPLRGTTCIYASHCIIYILLLNGCTWKPHWPFKMSKIDVRTTEVQVVVV